MEVALFLVMVASVVLLILGMVRPSAAWPGKRPHRGKIAALYLAVLIVAFFSFGASANSTTNASDPGNKDIPTLSRPHSPVPVVNVGNQQFDINNASMPVQNALEFTAQGDNYDIADEIKGDLGLCNWIGSNSMPGVVTTHSMAHGATKVVWRVPDKNGHGHGSTDNEGWTEKDGVATFIFKISEDGSSIWALNDNANSVFTQGDAGADYCP